MGDPVRHAVAMRDVCVWAVRHLCCADAMTPCLNWLRCDLGYEAPREIPGERYAAIAPDMFEYAIIIGAIGDTETCLDRWVYNTLLGANAALNAWERDGYVGEPVGWSRHPLTNRVRTQSSWEQEKVG